MRGIHLTLLIGPTLPVPAPQLLTEAMQSIEVTHDDEGRSGFQVNFQVGRSGPLDLLDYQLIKHPLLKPFNRIILVVAFNAISSVLMDGIIIHQQLSPAGEPGASTVIITGEDISVMMDMEEKSVEHPAQDDYVIANKIILNYSQYGLIPEVIPPGVLDQPIPTERIPVQQDTDLKYLKKMAERHAYAFYVKPGPAPYTNTAYWGPPIRVGLPQRALSVNMGPETNVESINFRNDALVPNTVSGRIQDRDTNRAFTVPTFPNLRPPLSSQPAWISNQPNVRRVQFRQTGLNATQSFARAQAMTDSASDVVTAEGELDALRYGGLLQPRGLVGLRGVGQSYDGFYYVKRVTHSIRKSEYKQHFTLTREGVGSTTPVVIP